MEPTIMRYVGLLLYIILTHLAYRANAKTCYINLYGHIFESARKVCTSWHQLLLQTDISRVVRRCNVDFTFKSRYIFM